MKQVSKYFTSTEIQRKLIYVYYSESFAAAIITYKINSKRDIA
jgi:hypothetical protein